MNQKSVTPKLIGQTCELKFSKEHIFRLLLFPFLLWFLFQSCNIFGQLYGTYAFFSLTLLSGLPCFPLHQQALLACAENTSVVQRNMFSAGLPYYTRLHARVLVALPTERRQSDPRGLNFFRKRFAQFGWCVIQNHARSQVNLRVCSVHICFFQLSGAPLRCRVEQAAFGGPCVLSVLSWLESKVLPVEAVLVAEPVNGHNPFGGRVQLSTCLIHSRAFVRTSQVCLSCFVIVVWASHCA